MNCSRVSISCLLLPISSFINLIIYFVELIEEKLAINGPQAFPKNYHQKDRERERGVRRVEQCSYADQTKHFPYKSGNVFLF